MADAVPVHSKSKKQKASEIEVVTHGDTTREDLLARAQEIVDSEAPAQVLDEQVNQIGQLSSYGKFQKVMEVPYDVRDRKGEPTGEVRTAIRIDH